MKEEYLHYLWKLKRLPLNNLKTVKNESLEIIDTGWLNCDTGPDFFNGKIRLNNMTWSGNIELHINASDWYKHNHHTDNAYDNVILHVVYEYDKPVFIDGNEIPTLELKTYIDLEHFSKYDSLFKNNSFIPCESFFENDELAIKQQIDVALFHRLERKSNELSLVKESLALMNKRDILMSSIFGAFGMRVNKIPFEELAQRLPVDVLMKESWDYKRLEAIVFGIAGLLNTELKDTFIIDLKSEWRYLKSKYDFEEMNSSAWKFGGVRPYNFPTIRIAQIVSFLSKWDYSDLTGLSAKQIYDKYCNFLDAQTSDYWSSHLRFGVKSKVNNQYITTEMRDLILINGVVPYLIYLKQYYNDFQAADVAMDLLEIIRPEKNMIIKKWKKMGVTVHTAMDSQGLLELKSQFCDFNRCLNCKIGHKLIEGASVHDFYDFYA